MNKILIYLLALQTKILSYASPAEYLIF